MTESARPTPPPRPGDDHAGASANPERHLAEAHALSIQIQGKEGSWGKAVWALVRQDRGKVKTLATFEGTLQAAANHFFDFIHPNRVVPASAAPSRQFGGYRESSRGGRPQGRPRDRS